MGNRTALCSCLSCGQPARSQNRTSKRPPEPSALQILANRTNRGGTRAPESARWAAARISAHALHAGNRAGPRVEHASGLQSRRPSSASQIAPTVEGRGSPSPPGEQPCRSLIIPCRPATDLVPESMLQAAARAVGPPIACKSRQPWRDEGPRVRPVDSRTDPCSCLAGRLPIWTQNRSSKRPREPSALQNLANRTNGGGTRALESARWTAAPVSAHVLQVGTGLFPKPNLQAASRAVGPPEAHKSYQPWRDEGPRVR